MPASNDCWGIEVGQSAVKAIRLQRSGNDVSVADFDVLPFKQILSTPELDVDEAIRVGLDQFMARHPIGKSTVVISVPGHAAFARFAKLPPVEPKKVPDIVRFEAVQQIPFPIEQVEWDYQTFQHADAPDVEVGIFAITKDRVMSWLANFTAVGLPVHGITLTSLAVYNALAYDLEMDDDTDGTILMDMGTVASDLIVVEGGRIWQRTIPIGGNHFTEALVRSFKLSFSKAEKLKREAATNKYARQIFQSMRPVFVDLVQEVQKSLGYYQSLNRESDLQRLFGVGSTFRLPGLQKFLRQQIQVEVNRLDSFKRIEVTDRSASTFGENVLSLAPAYGLALQGLGMERVTCNVLPAHVVRQQVWHDKQPWFIGAAAGVLLAFGLAYGKQTLERRQYDAGRQDVKEKVDPIINRAKRNATDWKGVIKRDARTRIENLQRVLDYRNLWPAIMADINSALKDTRPQPELLSGDYEQVKSIPRRQRRQMFIERIDTVYAPPTDQKKWRQQAEQDVKSRTGGMPGRRAAATEAPAGSTTRTPARGATGSRQTTMLYPSYLVTLTGTTPMDVASAPTFLENTFIRWLNDHKYEPGRAYRIVEASMMSLTDVGTDKGSAGPSMALMRGPTNLMPPGTNAIPGGPAPIPGMNRTGGPGMMPGIPNFPGTMGAGQAVGPRNALELLPKDPLIKEDHSKDQRFVITWRIELIPPEHIRKTAQPAVTEDTEVTDNNVDTEASQ